MLLDPTFVSTLNNTPGFQTLNFVKNVMKGLSYIDIQVSSTTLTCQVKSGDGQNLTATTNVVVQFGADDISIPPAPSTLPTISASTGIVKSGAGTNCYWVQTNSSGAFTLSIFGSGNVLVQMTPNQGVSMSVGLVL